MPSLPHRFAVCGGGNQPGIPMFVSIRIAANAVLLVASVGAGAAMAQQPAPQSASAPKPTASGANAMAPVASAAAGPMVYRSAFDGYKGLTDQPVQSWRESNDTVVAIEHDLELHIGSANLDGRNPNCDRYAEHRRK